MGDRTELITHVVEDSREVVVLRHNGQLWVLVFEEDPGLDYAVDPTGYVCADIYDPQGPYSHYRVPPSLFQGLQDLNLRLGEC